MIQRSRLASKYFICAYIQHLNTRTNQLVQFLLTNFFVNPKSVGKVDLVKKQLSQSQARSLGRGMLDVESIIILCITIEVMFECHRGSKSICKSKPSQHASHRSKAKSICKPQITSNMLCHSSIFNSLCVQSLTVAIGKNPQINLGSTKFKM